MATIRFRVDEFFNLYLQAYGGDDSFSSRRFLLAEVYFIVDDSFSSRRLIFAGKEATTPVYSREGRGCGLLSAGVGQDHVGAIFADVGLRTAYILSCSLPLVLPNNRNSSQL